MPDISIEPIRPGVSSNASVPDTTAVSKANQQVFTQAAQSINDLGRQYQTTQDANALISYNKQITELDDQTAFETDPKKIIPNYQAGQNKIQAAITKQYPSLSESGLKSIQIAMSHDLREHTVRAANQLREQAEKDATDFAADTVELAKNANSKTKQENILNGALNHYDELVKNNIWSPQHAQLQKTKLIKDVREGEAEILSTEHPKEFFKTTPDQLGISSEKFHQLAIQASKTYTNEELARTQQINQMKQEKLMELTPENAQQFLDNGWVEKGTAEIVAGRRLLTHEEEEQGPQDNLAAYYQEELSKATSKDEIDAIMRKAVRAGAKGVSRYELNSYAIQQKGDLNNSFKQTNKEYMANLDNTLHDPDIGDPDIREPSGDREAKDDNFNKLVKATTAARLDGAKDSEAAHKIYLEADKSVRDYYAARRKADAAPAPTSTSATPDTRKE